MDNIEKQNKIITKFYNEVKEIAREKGIEQGLDKKGYLLPFYNRVVFHITDFAELYRQFDKNNKLNDEDGYALFNFANYVEDKLYNNEKELMAFEFIKNCFNEYKKTMFVSPLANLGLLGEAVIVFKGKWPFNETDNMYKISHYEKYSYLFGYLNEGEKILEEEIIKELNNYNIHNGLFVCNKELFERAAKMYKKIT